MRELTPEFSLGVNAGVDYGSRVFRNEINGGRYALYNKLAFVGGYNF